MKKLVLKNRFSPGDIVAMTAAVRDLHRWYPGHFLTDVRTACPALWENNPYLVPLEEGAPDVETIECDYPLISRCDEVPYHCLHGISDFLNERLELHIKPTTFHGDIHLSDLERSWISQVHELTGEDIPFWIVVAGGKFDFTIKWWSTERYQEVIDHFRGKIQFVQVGAAGHYHPKLDGVIDLRGQTDLRQLVRLVYHSQGVLCPVTVLMHLAAAVEVRGGSPPKRACVVVAGGREPPHWEAYPHHQFIHTVGALPCCATGGCWKARTLPLGDGDERDQNLCVDVVGSLPHCMDMISSAEVIRRVETYFKGGVLEYLSPTQALAGQRAVEATLDNPLEAFASWPAPLCKAILIQQASGRHLDLLDLSAPVHNAYAVRHQFTFWAVRGDVQTERPPVWNRVLLIQRALRLGFELVVWLDADTLIVDPEADFRSALPPGPPIGMCCQPLAWRDQPWHFNAGVIAVRNTSSARDLFDRVWDEGPVDVPWQEQDRLNDLARRFPELFQRLDDRWNVTYEVTASPEPVVLAWHGMGKGALALMRNSLAAWYGADQFLAAG